MPRKFVIGEGVKVRTLNLAEKVTSCPKCGTKDCKRHTIGHRWLRDAGTSCPVVLEVTYSKHYCPKCEHYFNLPMNKIAQPGSNFTNRVQKVAVDLVAKQGMTYEKASQYMEQKHYIHIPITTIHEWVVNDFHASGGPPAPPEGEPK